MKFRAGIRPSVQLDNYPVIIFMVYLLAVLVFFLFCVGAVVLIAFIVEHAKPPQCHLVGLRLGQINTSDTKVDNVGRMRISLHVEVNVFVQNRNRNHGLWYDRTIISVFIDSQVAGQATFDPFYQDSNEGIDIRVDIHANELLVEPETIPKFQHPNSANNQTVDVEVKIHVRAKAKILNWFPEHFSRHLSCTSTVLVSPAPGQSASRLKKKCKEERWLPY